MIQTAVSFSTTKSGIKIIRIKIFAAINAYISWCSVFPYDDYVHGDDGDDDYEKEEEDGFVIDAAVVYWVMSRIL